MSIEDEGGTSEGAADGSALQLADIFARTDYTQQVQVKRDFRPWHRPRKQVVRQVQWGSEIDWLIRQKSSEDQTFRYLGLPGADLLDIRYFYRRFFNGGERQLAFLGFDDSARMGSAGRDALNISLNEVRRLENIDMRSDVVGDDFRRLSDQNSIAWELAQRIGSFDIINVDLCGHMTRDEPAIDLSYYNAIYQLCGLQQRHRGPWSLFLTSRLDQANIAVSTLTRLLEVLKGNIEGCADFAAAFDDCFGSLQYTVESAQTGWGSPLFFKVMCVAIAKWFLSMAYQMRNTFSISSIAGYKINGRASYLDMVSLVLRFEPSPAIGPDRVGLASAARELSSECVQAAPIPKKAAGVIDIDKILRDSPAQWRNFAEATGELLELARYSAADYRRWAEKDFNLSDQRDSVKEIVAEA